MRKRHLETLRSIEFRFMKLQRSLVIRSRSRISIQIIQTTKIDTYLVTQI
jgi:hypothetical protein